MNFYKVSALPVRVSRDLPRLIAVLLLLVAAQNARSATFVISNLNDSGPGSLRSAVSLANENTDEDSIVFDRVVFAGMHTIVLTSGEIVITTPIRILGPGADRLAISGNDASRIFFVRNTALLRVNGLTVRNGKAPVFAQNGFSNHAGGIYVDGGSLFLNQVAISNCSAEQGGGMYNRLGNVQIVKSTISGNQATGGRTDGSYGGGINNEGSLLISNSRITGNAARGGTGGSGIAGGIYNFNSSTLNISQSVIENNQALGGNSASGFGGAGSGGGIYMSGTVVITNSLINNNSSVSGTGDIPSRSGNASGGGITNLNDAQLINVTVSNNSIASLSAGFVTGGAGIWNGCTSCLTLTNATVAFNNANTLGGGGVYGYNAFRIRNTVIAKNLAAYGPDILNTVTSLGNNVVGDGTEAFGIADGVNGDHVGTGASPINPLLNPLADNGGLTQTFLPQPGSVLIDNGNNCVVQPTGGCLTSPLLYDQRGFARPAPTGGVVDIGTVEAGSTAVVPAAPGVPDLDAASDLGISDTDNLTSSLNPRFSISNVPAGAQVELLRDGTVVSVGYSAAGGTVSLDDSPGADGTFNYASRVLVNGSLGTTSAPLSVQFDTVRPVVAVEQAAQQPDPTAIGTAAFSISFSEPVNGFAASDVSLAGSTANIAAATVSATGGGTSFAALVENIVSDGQFVRVSIPASSVMDDAGNPNGPSVSTDNSVTIDNVRPTVTVNQASGQPDPAVIQPITFSAIFSEAVSGFTAADVSLAGSTANVSSANINIVGGPASYTISISGIRSSGTVRVSISANSVQDALGNLNFGSVSTDNTVTFSLRSAAFDFDGDGKTDIGITRPLPTTEWWINRSGDGQTLALQFGSSSDRVAPADYTGDGKADITFWRPSTGEWYVLRSEDNSFFSFPFGTNGDIPAPADFDADGKADFAVFRPSSATWYIRRSTDGQVQFVGFGANGDAPIPSDFDGDGKADVAIVRNNAGITEWWIQRSTNGSVLAMQFGSSTDKSVPGDYTGDGRTDVAFWRSSTGEWYIVRSEDFSYFAFPFGANGDTPAPGDYDGDGKTDPTVFRPSSATWFIARSTAGTQIVQFGANGDRPVPSAFVP